MEKKTMGSFIAVLRKSMGLTQKQLADQLNVSDKTISHWERDESAPDLSLIPVLAEIFGVTCDELLRGEKNSNSASVEITHKGEKQLEYLLTKSFNTLKIRSLFYIAISIVGFICGIILLYEDKGNAGFLASLAFGVIAFVLNLISYIMYSFSIKSYELDEKVKTACIQKGNTITARIVYFIIFVLAFSVSLTQCGPYLDDIMNVGLLYAGGAVVACIVIDIVLRSLGVFYKKKRTEQEKKILCFSTITFTTLAVVLICTGIFQYVSMAQTAKLGDIFSMLRYVIYPLEVIVAFFVYALGMKNIKGK